MRKKIYSLILFLGFFCFFSQENKTRDIKNHPDLIRYMTYGKGNHYAKQDYKVSEYHGLEQSISAFFYYSNIPQDFPKSSPEKSKDDYVNEINVWFSKNPDRIKPEMRNKKLNQNGDVYEN
ncbi:MAG: hypothetical protein N3F09_09835 [Bacteroidia bacterium]|nr:hypothetical protein [Bacteroidia bacterium]